MNHITQAMAEAFAHRRATKYVHRSAPGYTSYAFMPHTLMDFVRDIEAAAIQAHIDAQKPESRIDKLVEKSRVDMVVEISGLQEEVRLLRKQLAAAPQGDSK